MVMIVVAFVLLPNSKTMKCRSSQRHLIEVSYLAGMCPTKNSRLVHADNRDACEP